MHSKTFLLAIAYGWLTSFYATAEAIQENFTNTFTATEIYEHGDVTQVKRSDSHVGIVLNDLTLLETDAPGAGLSEKGLHTESLHAGIRLQKIIHVPRPTASKAHVLIYMTPQTAGTSPKYTVYVNGHSNKGIAIPWHEGVWHWVPIPVKQLQQGDNLIELHCDAPEGKGYEVLFARADEYARGGGAWLYQGNTSMITSGRINPVDQAPSSDIQSFTPGAFSGKSTDEGKTWKHNTLGAENNLAGEYGIRLNLEQYQPSGTLITPPIDLWENPSTQQAFIPTATVKAIQFKGTADLPKGTTIKWAYRLANTPDRLSETWSDFSPLTKSESLEVALHDIDQRFMQVRIHLSTQDPLATPTFYSLKIIHTIEHEALAENSFYVRSQDNPRIDYPAYHPQYESASTEQLKLIRERLKLDKLLAGAHGDFEKINRLRHYISQLWYHALPYPEYPEWNALDILDRNEKQGWGGMCMQFTITFVQALQSLGYQARHVNLFNHEAPEVYIDELGKWVLVDAESVFDSYEYDTRTGEPLNALEQHEFFLKRYGFTPDNPIPWMSSSPWSNWPKATVKETPQPLGISTHTGWINDPDPEKRVPQHNLSGFLRIIPRNNFLSSPTPRPLNNGSTYWPWSGYLCWYDEATPRKLHYAMHTDRVADFYPTLNRVAFIATHSNEVGKVKMEFYSQTPNLANYEINIDGQGWQKSEDQFEWTLRPSAVNRIEMRTRNALGITGKSSHLEVLWNYQAPYEPKPAD